jgi:hypothetical protein
VPSLAELSVVENLFDQLPDVPLLVKDTAGFTRRSAQ